MDNMYLISLIEKKLNVILPQSYTRFIMRYTEYKENYPFEIYHINLNMIDFYKIPCVIGATLYYRNQLILPEYNSLAIANFDEIIYYLNTEYDCMHSVNFSNNDTSLNLNFQGWLNKWKG